MFARMTQRLCAINHGWRDTGRMRIVVRYGKGMQPENSFCLAEVQAMGVVHRRACACANLSAQDVLPGSAQVDEALLPNLMHGHSRKRSDPNHRVGQGRRVVRGSA